MAEIYLPHLLTAIQPGYSYRPISAYPPIIEEITIKSDLLVGDLIQFIKDTDPLITQVRYLGSFQNKHSFRLVFSSSVGNLNQAAVDKIKEVLSQTVSRI